MASDVRRDAPGPRVLEAIRKLGSGAAPAAIQRETGLGRGAVDYWLDRLEAAETAVWERDWRGRRIPGAVTITGRAK